jgi:hypothetical protein
MGHAFARKSWKLVSKHMENDEESDVSVVQATTLLATFDFTGTSKYMKDRQNVDLKP